MLLVLSSFVSGAHAGFDWGSTSMPSFRVPTTSPILYGATAIHEGSPTATLKRYHLNGTVLVTTTLAVGTYSGGSTPPSGTLVDGGSRLGGVYGSPVVGSAWITSAVGIPNGGVYFAGWDCTSAWVCQYGIYRIQCRDIACTGYTSVKRVKGFANPVSTRTAWIDLLAPSSNGNVLAFRRVEQDTDGANTVAEIWTLATNTLVATKTATNLAAGIPIIGDLQILPGMGAQITLVKPATTALPLGSGALYKPGVGWKLIR